MLLIPLCLTLLLILCCASLAIVRHFLSPKAREIHVVVVTASSLLIGFTTALLPSLDVFVTAKYTQQALFLETVYLGLFTLTGVWLGILIPFSFFFAKSKSSIPLCQRVCAALQRTGIYFLVLVTLLLVGLAFRPGHETWSSEPLSQSWMSHLFDTKHQGTSAILFLTGVLATVGCTGFILYTAYGLATLPLDLIRGYKDPELERLDIETELIKIRSRLRMLDKKRSNTSGHLSTARLKLEDAISIKQQHIRALDQLGDDTNTSCCRFRLVGPCRAGVGVLLLCVTCFLTSALVLSASDPGLESASGCTTTSTTSTNANSEATAQSDNTRRFPGLGNVVKLVCQAETGYLGTLLNKPRLVNHFDESLVMLSELFPLDMVVMSGALAFMFVASLYGVLRLGLRCCVCLAVYRFKRRQTSSSAMLIFGAVVLVMALALVSQVPALAPKYATFGSQMVRGHVHCSLSDEAENNKHCTMSQIAVLLVTLVKEFPMFSHLFYLTSWLHAAVVILSLLLRGVCGGRAANFTGADFRVSTASGMDDEDSDVELAKQRLIVSDDDDEEEDDDDTWRSRRSNNTRKNSIVKTLGAAYL
jgi:LMBR1 domain-containing protein 1